jgi:hypothetical protein
MEEFVETDPALAIGTAKELVKTTCKIILWARGKSDAGNPDSVTSAPLLFCDTIET